MCWQRKQREGSLRQIKGSWLTDTQSRRQILSLFESSGISISSSCGKQWPTSFCGDRCGEVNKAALDSCRCSLNGCLAPACLIPQRLAETSPVKVRGSKLREQLPLFRGGANCSVMKKLPRLVLAIAGALLLVLTIARVLASWANDSHLEHVSGVWIALAVDLDHAVFYRPPFGPYGYGGTRFFPLYFSLHAAGIRIFGGWRATGYFLSTLSVLLLLAGIFYLLRRLGADRWLATG